MMADDCVAPGHAAPRSPHASDPALYRWSAGPGLSSM